MKGRQWKWVLQLESSLSGAMGSAGGKSEAGGGPACAGGAGTEQDKSPRVKPGREFSEGTRSGENGGREKKLPVLPFT